MTKRTLITLSGMLSMALIAGCAGDSNPGDTESAGAVDTAAGVERAPFGVTPDGDSVDIYTFSNENGMEVRAMTYGGIIVSLMVPDRSGQLADVVLGFDSLQGYIDSGNSPYFGAIIGRYGNRIAGGEFELNDTTYELAKNNGPNSLHGGVQGWDKVVWDAEPFSNEDGRGVIFRYTSPAGEEGYPGTVQARVTYTLTDDNELIFDYHATTDEATPVNLTQHSYFNLSGHDAGDILGEVVTINADAFTPVDSTLIPTGETRDVEGTPFDFREPTPIGERIDADNQQIRFGPGYDHNFVLHRDGPVDEPELAARVVDPSSGRVMEILTTEPGLQFYSGNFLDGTLTGKGGVQYQQHGGFAMETQHFPDSPNQPDFPSTILQPGEQYNSTTIYRFSTTDETQD